MSQSPRRGVEVVKPLIDPLKRRIGIVGGSVSGLLLAHALLNKGFRHIKVFEKRSKEEFERFGGGVVIPSNGTLALKYINEGLCEKVKNASHHINYITQYSTRGTRLHAFHPDDLVAQSRLEANHTRERNAPIEPTLCLPRHELKKMLAKSLAKSQVLQYSRAVTQIDLRTSGPEKEPVHEVEVDVANARPVKLDFLIGADGLHSTTRKLLFPTIGVRQHALVQVSGLCGLKADDLPEYDAQNAPFTEYVGPQGKFAFCEAGHGLFSWHARVTEDHLDSLQEDHKQLATGPLAEFPREAEVLITKTKPKHVAVKSVADIVPFTDWQRLRGRVGLIGDAVHPSIDVFSQSVAMEIESALILSKSFTGQENVLMDYEFLRHKRAFMVTNWSYDNEKFDMSLGRFMSVLRDLSAPWMPRTVRERVYQDMFGHDPMSLYDEYSTAF